MGLMFDLPVVECAVPDIFVTGIVRIEFVGDAVRLVFGVEQDGEMGREIMVVSKLVWSLSRLPDGIRRIATAAAAHGVLCSCAGSHSCH